MIGDVGDELDGNKLGTSVGSSLEDLEGEDEKESGDLSGAVDGCPVGDATGDPDWMLIGDAVGDIDGGLIGDIDGDAVGDIDGDAVGATVGVLVTDAVWVVVGFEEGLTGAFVGAAVTAFTSPSDRNAVSILP